MTQTPPYLDPEQPLDARVADLVSQMTLAEKVSQMVYDAPAIERLGVPAYNWWNECLHGVGRAGVATVFPQAIGLAATWNPDLLREVAVAISDEARAKHHEALRRGIRSIYSGLTFWTPNVNIVRDPRWGRNQETYGEDPILTARLAVAFIRGLQGEDRRYLKVAACAKHFAVHSGPEPQRHRFDAVVGARDLRETYLPAFEACVKEAGVTAVMGAYNRVNGEPCCASPTLLGQILRGEWGFDGHVVSDCWAIRDIYRHHRVVETAAEAAALAVNAGCDLNCGDTYPALLDAVDQGLIDEATIDRAVGRLMRDRFRLGLFDPPERVPFAQIPYAVVNSPQHRALAREAARQSIVLLKNEGDLLPLSKEIASIAVIGPNADDLQALLGNYNGTPAQAVTPLEGIRRKVSSATTVYFAQGCDVAAGAPALRPVPASCLRPAGGDAGQVGLRGAYFHNAALQGDPVLVRTDAVVHCHWKGESPLTGGWGDPFSVRWKGSLVPSASGAYRLGVRGHNSFRLFLDGRLLVEHEGVHHPHTASEAVQLQAGRLYDLRLEFASTGLDPQVELLWAPPAGDLLSAALEAARRAEVVVLVLGLSPNLEGEEMPVEVEGFHRGDRTDIRLPRPQRALVRAIHDLGKPVVLVLLSGSAVAVDWAARHVPAIVQAWYAGEAGGDAIADVLFGDANPAGRLPVTVYRSVDDLPPFEDYAVTGRTYRYFGGEPLYPFGHGLSYTRFEHAGLDVTAGDGGLTVAVDVANVGERGGDEVVQVYARALQPGVPGPRQRLVAFRRVHLQPGETRPVSLEVALRDLAYFDEASGGFVVEPGPYEIRVGASSADIRLIRVISI